MSRRGKTIWYWVAYPDGIEKVQLIEEGVGDRVVKRGVYKKPVTVENEDGDEYIVSHHELYHDPIAASIKVVELREKLGLSKEDFEDDAPLELEKNPVEGEEEDEDDDLDLDDETDDEGDDGADEETDS